MVGEQKEELLPEASLDLVDRRYLDFGGRQESVRESQRYKNEVLLQFCYGRKEKSYIFILVWAHRFDILVAVDFERFLL